MSGYISSTQRLTGLDPIQLPGNAVRQTVQTGLVDANGQAAFLQIGSGLAVNLLASSVPLVMSFAAGFSAKGPVDYHGLQASDVTGAWTLPASTTAYLYADRNPGTGKITFGYSTVVPVYSTVAPSGGDKLIPAMTSNTTPSGTASAGSVLSANYPAFKAFDRGADATYPCWISGSTTADWLAYAFGLAQAIGSYTVAVPTAGGLSTYAGAAPKNWTLQGSNDGTNWTTIDTQSNQTAWGSGESRTFTLPLPVTYSQYRLNISANNGGSYIAVDTFQVYSGIQTDQHWFDLTQFTMKRWTGSAWEAKQRVFLGEAVTGASAVLSVTSYALQGQYESGRFSLTAGTIYSKAHNLGVSPKRVVVMAATAAGGNLYFTEYWGTGNTGITWGDLSRTTLKVFTHTAKDILTGPSTATAAVEAIAFAARGW